MGKKLTVIVADRAHAHIYETSRDSNALLRVGTLGNPNARLHERNLGSSTSRRSFNHSTGIPQLAQIRNALPRDVPTQVVREIAKDLVHQSKRVITAHLRTA